MITYSMSDCRDQVPFSLRLLVLGDGSILSGMDKHIRSWVQTSLMIARQILLRGWRNEGLPSIQEWACEIWLGWRRLKKYHINGLPDWMSRLENGESS